MLIFCKVTHEKTQILLKNINIIKYIGKTVPQLKYFKFHPYKNKQLLKLSLI